MLGSFHKLRKHIGVGRWSVKGLFLVHKCLCKGRYVVKKCQKHVYVIFESSPTEWVLSKYSILPNRHFSHVN